MSRRTTNLDDALILGLCVVAIVGSLILGLQGSDDVQAGETTLPVLCPSRGLFETDCPGCGLTRSFLLLTQGDVLGSLKMHPMGIYMYLLILAQIPYRLWVILRKVSRDRRSKWLALPVWAAVAGLLVTWIIRLVL